ncbi:beta-glucosidase 24 [Manihot esculenta]|nr:beta-glucosidase 24 [Manihot esculenta]
MDGSNGDVAVDFYNRYLEDIKRMKAMGFESFRFSISWSRIIPSGKVHEGVNEQGIKFYNNLINALLKNGMEPYVTIFHWDTPQALEEKYGGFLSSKIVDDFHDFARLCFEKFGDRVKYWVTLNEPWSVALFAYDLGVHAPGRCSSWMNQACQAGNSSTEPYIISHNLLLSHATTVQLYRQKYQAIQKGKIGITLNSMWFEPYSNSTVDKKAAKTAIDFMFGWYMNPVTYGNYPRSMRKLVGDRLPKFKPKESKLLKGSYDFLGLNYYTSNYAKGNANVDPHFSSYSTDNHVNQTPFDQNGNLIGPQAHSPWLYIYPKGIRYLLNYIKDTYKNPIIYITENGVDELNNKTLTLKQALDDRVRKEYYETHLWNVHRSIKEYNVKVKGYFAWSYSDNFEWNIGYTSRFGLIYIDYERNLTRHLKQSAIWFQKFLKKQ